MAGSVGEVERPPRPENNPVAERVYDVCTDLRKGAVSENDRGTLRRELDKADVGLVGRPKSDAALNGISKRGG